MSLAELQRVITEAVAAHDPIEALAALRQDAALSEQEQVWLADADPDGLRLTAMLVKKLRFERILRGDPTHRRAFEDDAEQFLAKFQNYLMSVPPTAVFPRDEAAAFTRFAE